MHVPMEMLKASAGFRMTHIPYTGAGPAVLALLGGQVDAVASGPSTVAQQIKAGKLRAAARQAALDPAVIQTINRAGSPLEYLDAPEFQAYWDTDARLMIEAVRKIGKLE